MEPEAKSAVDNAVEFLLDRDYAVRLHRWEDEGGEHLPTIEVFMEAGDEHVAAFPQIRPYEVDAVHAEGNDSVFACSVLLKPRD